MDDRVGRARRAVAHAVHQREALRTRLASELQRAEILQAENGILVAARTEARARWTERGTRDRLRRIAALGVALVVAIVAGAALLSSFDPPGTDVAPQSQERVARATAPPAASTRVAPKDVRVVSSTDAGAVSIDAFASLANAQASWASAEEAEA